jgi:hypothetical protein
MAMAFNPFESFRKNGKAIFAVLAIVCMFTFVLSSGIGGGNDFFDWVVRQFGGDDKRGPLYGEIDGHDYHQRELDALRQKRMAANAYMRGAVDHAENKMVNQLGEDLKNNVIKDKQASQLISNTLNLRGQMFDSRQRDPRTAAQVFFLYQMSPEALSRTLANINAKDNPADARALRRMTRVVDGDMQRLARGNSAMYFATVPNANDKDALEFAMYLDEADKMGIKFSDDDIRKLIGDETDNMLTEKDGIDLDQAIRQRSYKQLSADAVTQAIGDEFRVRTVLSILNGAVYPGGRMSVPAGMTPYEFAEFFKDRVTSLTFDVVDVAVEDFIAQVKQEPTEREIQDFFDKYKAREYDPAIGTPGFKEPRKVKVEYVGVDGTKPVYKAALAPLQAARIVSGVLNDTMLGGSPAAIAYQVARPHLATSLEAYTGMQSKIRGRKFELFGYTVHGSPFSKARPEDESLFHPLPNAALTAQLAVMSNPVTDLSGAVAAYQNLTGLLDTRDRVRIGMQMSVAPIGFNPLFPLSVAGPYIANLPRVPEEVYQAQETAAIAENQAYFLAHADFESLQKKLNDIRKKVQPEQTPEDIIKKKERPKTDPAKVAEANAEARKLIDEWLKAHPDAQHGQSADARGKFTISDDAGLKALTELVKDKTAPEVSQSYGDAFFDPIPPKESADVTYYSPTSFPGFSMPPGSAFTKPVYLAWKTQDLPAQTHPGKLSDLPAEKQGEVRAQVIRAWKFEKARKLAEAAANKLADELRELATKELRDADNPVAFSKGLADKVAAGKFALLTEKIRIQMLKQHPSFQPGQPNSWMEDRITNKQILYPVTKSREHPGPGMAEQLLELRTKQVGEVLVSPDVPQSHYYVSVLAQKRVPTTFEFYMQVFSKTNAPPREERDSLYSNFARREAINDFFKDALARVKAEMKYKETDELKKSTEKNREEPSE